MTEEQKLTSTRIRPIPDNDVLDAVSTLIRAYGDNNKLLKNTSFTIGNDKGVVTTLGKKV